MYFALNVRVATVFKTYLQTRLTKFLLPKMQKKLKSVISNRVGQTTQNEFLSPAWEKGLII